MAKTQEVGVTAYENKVFARFWRDAGKGPPNECWVWTGGVTGKRYGRLNVLGGGHVSAHRYSYELHIGKIPDGSSVNHSCGQKLCVNPNHLVLDAQRGPVNLEGRFWRRVEVGDPEKCWRYKGPFSHNGYGRFSACGKWFRAHRFAYEISHGVPPQGLLVRHLCHNRLCVNPAHLALGTSADNGRDTAVKNFSERYTGIAKVARQNWFCHPHRDGAAIRCYLCNRPGREHAETYHGYICPETPKPELEKPA